MIRQPEFVNESIFSWACQEVKKKKPQMDVTKARLANYEEGLCVQIMHIGSYDNERESIDKMDLFINKMNLQNDISSKLPNGMIKRHHEIYLSDPRKVAEEKRKTVIRHPVRQTTMV